MSFDAGKQLSRFAATLVFGTFMLGVTVLTGTGCTGQVDSMDLMDEQSRNRFERIPNDGFVLASLKCAQGESVPSLEGTRVLGQAGRTVLIETAHSSWKDLPLADIEEVVIWGDAGATRRLSSALRNQILRQLEKDGLSGTQLSMIASFKSESPNIDRRIRELGGTTGSVTGTIVTIEADPSAALRILGIPELLSLEESRTRLPTEQ